MKLLWLLFLFVGLMTSPVPQKEKPVKKIKPEIKTNVVSLDELILPGPEGYRLPQNPVELRSEFTFPRNDFLEKKYEFLGPTGILMRNDGSVCVLDQKTIFLFDEEGRFTDLFPKSTEFLGQINTLSGLFESNDHYLTIGIVFGGKNPNKKFLITLDREGKISNKYNLPEVNFRILGVSSDGLIYLNRERVAAKDDLIQIVGQKGRILDTFGAPVYDYEKYSSINDISLSVGKDGELYIAFKYFPIIRKYSRQGRLLAEMRIMSSYAAEKETLNLNLAKYSDRMNIPVRYYAINQDLEIMGNKIYILSYYPRTEILECTMDGKIISTYWIDPDISMIPTKLFVRNEGAKKRFYLYQMKRASGALIEALQPKEK